MSKLYAEMVKEMLARMTDEDKESMCKQLLEILGVKTEKPKMDKHCPLCGGDLEIDEKIDERTFRVTCTKCHSGGICGIREDDEDLPTKGTLEYGKMLQGALMTMADMCDEMCEDDDEDEDDYEENRAPGPCGIRFSFKL